MASRGIIPPASRILEDPLRSAYDSALAGLRQAMARNSAQIFEAWERAIQEIWQGWIDLLHRPFAPGTFYGDLLALANPQQDPAVRLEAAERLVRVHLNRRFLYGTTPGLQARWTKVRPAFLAYCRESGLSPQQAWQQLTLGIVTELVYEARQLPLKAVRGYMAREMRKRIERELLGRTADEREPEEQLVDQSLPVELHDVRLEVMLALSCLDPLERQLLTEALVEGWSHRELAERYRTSIATLSRIVRRARQQLLEHLHDS